MKTKNIILLSFVTLTLACQSVPTKYFSGLPQGTDIILDEPSRKINVDLIKAFKLRKSTKIYSEKEVGLNELSTILWSANGINRKDGKRTAPSPFAKELINIYVFSETGIYYYDARQHTLLFRSSADTKKEIGAESGARGVESATFVLLLTGDIAVLPDFLSKAVKVNSAHATAGAVGQNIYLIANALDLRTRFVGSLSIKGVRNSLKLSEEEIPLYIMPLGHKR